jgi:hypothetical protein
MEWWQIQELMITLAVIVGVLVPVFALTYRFLAKTPDQPRFGRKKQGQAALLRDQRLDHIERQIGDLEGLVRRLVDAAEFDRQLKSGEPPADDAETVGTS